MRPLGTGPRRISSRRAWTGAARRCAPRNDIGGALALRDLLGRSLDHFGALLESRDDLRVHPVGDAELDLGLLRLLFGFASGELDEGLLAAVLEGHDPLGHDQDILLFADDQVRVGGIAGAQDDAARPVASDLAVETRCALLLDRK